MIKGFSLTQQQIDLVLKYRNEAQTLTAELFHNLVDSDAKDISLVVLAETAGLSADVIALTTSIGNNEENLKANQCVDINQFKELLFLYVINKMIVDVKSLLGGTLDTVKSKSSSSNDDLSSPNIDNQFIESLLKEANKSVKH